MGKMSEEAKAKLREYNKRKTRLKDITEGDVAMAVDYACDKYNQDRTVKPSLTGYACRIRCAPALDDLIASFCAHQIVTISSRDKNGVIHKPARFYSCNLIYGIMEFLRLDYHKKSRKVNFGLKSWQRYLKHAGLIK